MKKKLMSKAWLTVLALAAMGLLAACMMPMPTPGPEQPAGVEPPASEAGVETMTLYVGPNLEPCVGVAPQTCMLVKENPDDEYSLFYGQIEGFEFEPGFEYELSVERTTIPNPPADASAFSWKLVEVVSKVAVEPIAALEGVTWELVAYVDSAGNLTQSLPEAPATLTLQDGQATGVTGCNNYFGTYAIDGEKLVIQPMGSTMMACPEPQMAQEQAYIAALSSVASYTIVGNQLQLANADGDVVLVFEPQVSTPLTGTLWSAISYNNGREAVVSVIAGSTISAIFGEDGTLTGSAGCNNYSAGYTTDGANVTISPAIATMMFCEQPEGLMEQEAAYLAALETAATWSISGDTLELRTADGALVAQYVASDEAAAPEPEAEAPATVDAATMEALGNMTYFNIAVTPTVTLTNGIYTSTIVPDSPLAIYVELTDYAVTGDLNGQPSIAAVLVSNGGGSGVFYDLAVVQDQDGELVNVATTNLGDRITLNSIEIVDNKVVVDMVTQGPTEPMCCGTLHVLVVYELQDGELVMTSSVEVASEPAATTPISIVGIVWEWVETAYGDGTTTTVPAPENYTLLLNPDGTATLQIDCNRGGGSYTLDGGSLSLDVATMTRVACPEGTLSDEYLRNLDAAATYVIDGSDLVLNLFADTGNMRFRMSATQPTPETAEPVAPQEPVTPQITQPAVAANIMLKDWQWVQFTDPVSGTQDIADPVAYTVQFQPSGSVYIQADCNRGGGSYTIDDSAISIEITFMTRAMCPPGSLSDQFVQRLNAAAVWFMDGEDLFIDLFADSGTMRFATAE
jgi:heat shock protein HslJ